MTLNEIFKNTNYGDSLFTSLTQKLNNKSQNSFDKVLLSAEKARIF
jgi:hypothetical protein